MKYKVTRAVQFEFTENEREQRQAENARLLAIHLVRMMNERKEENNESKEQ